MAKRMEMAVVVMVMVMGFVSMVGMVRSQAVATCPWTGEAAKPPTRAQTRCKSAASLSCCGDCGEISLALKEKSANLSVVLAKAGPMLGKNGAASLTGPVCSYLAGYHRCQALVEAFGCAISCDPTSGNFIEVNADRSGTVYICEDVMVDLYNSCGSVEFPPPVGALRDRIPGGPSMLSMFIGLTKFSLPVGPMGGHKTVTFRVVKKGDFQACYMGLPETSFPAAPLCCDPIAVPEQCAASIKGTRSLAVAGEPVTDPTCSAVNYAAPPPSAAGDSADETSAMGMALIGKLFGQGSP
ncbi:hypothetical protein CBR_g29772 [Chara braunii]|uniref:Pherophorin domain-containing protein n=1 Tax=Chara braunii TaxID=69332 RepID=A0A388LBR0_CHABU|nr:hypothetical protein CBR_g29772 [Chara braunii]|eukprot:GBG79623.1 hypothetical protein CBR_g29772 [Chara braunii]